MPVSIIPSNPTSQMSSFKGFDPIAHISLGAFRHNVSVVRSLLADNVKLMAVVKANAYGHGMSAIAQVAEKSGVDALGVFRVQEGIELREAGLSLPILMMGESSSSSTEQAVRADLQMSLSSVAHAERMASVATKMGKTISIHVKVDTGMSRFGVDFRTAADSIEQIARMKGLEIAGLSSHFANADEEDGSFAREQLERFNQVLEDLRRRKIDVPLRHIANSSGVVSLKNSHLDMVRVGLVLYGIPPRRSMDIVSRLQPVLSLTAPISVLKRVQAGSSVSYGRRYVSKNDTWVAVIPMGYGDGYSRMLTGKGEALINGRRYPIAGTICMDSLMIDVGRNPDCSEGDRVTFIGRDGDEEISAWDVAERLGTIPYEVTCMISARVRRVYAE